MLGDIEATVQFHIPNKKKLLVLKTRELSLMNETLMNRMKLISTPSLKICPTTKALNELMNKINEYIIKATSHNIKQ